jgi:hypothetical protein
MCEKRITFRVSAPVFLHEDDDNTISYSVSSMKAYIEEHGIAELLAQEIAIPYEWTNNKCLQSVTYDKETGFMTAILQILINESCVEFADSTDHVPTLKGLILDCPFEDGIYEGDGAQFIMGDSFVGVFDIRSAKDLRVEVISEGIGPSVESYEAEWRATYQTVASKLGADEVVGDYKSYSAVYGGDTSGVFHNLYTKYMDRGIYDMIRMYRQILEKPFYKTEDERLEALVRIIQ